MNGYRIDDKPTKEVWSAFLGKSASGNLQQSFEYGQVVESPGVHIRVLRLLAMGEGEPAGLVQGTYRKRFGFGDSVEVGGVYGCGPLIPKGKNEQLVLKELVLALEKHAIANRVSEASIHQLEASRVLEDMGYCLGPAFNVYKVALSKNVDDLWNNIAHNKRRNIRKAQEQHVEVVGSSGYDSFVSFYKMLTIAGERAEFIPPTFNLLHAYFKVFGDAGKLRILLATLEGRPVAGVFIVVHGDTAYALGAGSRDEVWHVRPNDILHWKAMEWACGEGLSYYHMGYVPEPLPTEGSELWGLWRWKREWNGQLEKTFVYHKVYMQKFRKFVLGPYGKIYNMARKMRS